MSLPFARGLLPAVLGELYKEKVGTAEENSGGKKSHGQIAEKGLTVLGEFFPEQAYTSLADPGKLFLSTCCYRGKRNVYVTVLTFHATPP